VWFVKADERMVADLAITLGSGAIHARADFRPFR
jgi:hypothetical protein